MKKQELLRTALFVPGNRPDLVDKAVRTDADAIIIDLEDTVPPPQKEETRHIVRQKIIEHGDRGIIARINGLESEYMRGDLHEVVVKELSSILMPKVEKRADIEEINRLLREEETKNRIPIGNISIIPLIESAMAVENSFRIASTRTDPDRLLTLAFGAADFALDMGITLTKTGEELSYARSRLAVACRAAGVEPPLDTPFMLDLTDREALQEDIRRARQQGFQGKLCIHPNQVEICNRLFSPSEDEIEYARKVIRSFENAEACGVAAIQMDGKFIDYPIVERAKHVLRLAEMGNRRQNTV